MHMIKLFLLMLACVIGGGARASVFFENEIVKDGLNVVEMSNTFADIYEKLDGVKWAGKGINVAIESLENLHPDAHIAATDERIVLVWRDSIIANYPRPAAGNWHEFGEITTALILKMREQDANLKRADVNDIYIYTVEGLMRGIDENGRYIVSRDDEIANDGRILTAVGLEGARDEYGNFRVTGIYRGAPADAAGISAGDIIDRINGVALPEMSDADLAATLTGFNSGTAKLHLLTPRGDKNVVLRRATIILADADVVHRDDVAVGAILDIVVHSVTENAAAIVNEALAKYDDITGIILDLRAAGGDDPRAAAKLAGLFIGARPVMRVAETASEEVEIIPGGDAVTDVPVVVLMSDQTRGTAEAVASAFYDTKRGVLVGTPTHGAARIASQLDLKNGGVLELYNKSVKAGTGRALDGRGVFPIVCLSNIRSSQQQNVFFLNVINDDFKITDFNTDTVTPVENIRRGCPVITSGTDEDALAAAVSVKILTDGAVYKRLVTMGQDKK